jgi:hypothetical protein
VTLAHLDLAEVYLRLGRADDSVREFETGRGMIDHNHPGDKRLAGVLDDTRAHLADIRAGKPLRCED